MLVKVNHNTHELSEQEEQYWLHALQGDPLIGDFLRKQGMFTDPRKLAMNQPVCPKCERMAWWHKDGVACATCGYEGPKAHKLKIHLREGHYR